MCVCRILIDYLLTYLLTYSTRLNSIAYAFQLPFYRVWKKTTK